MREVKPMHKDMWIMLQMITLLKMNTRHLNNTTKKIYSLNLNLQNKICGVVKLKNDFSLVLLFLLFKLLYLI